MRTIGVDTGGTFTDLVLLDGDEVHAEKLTSTPDDPARAVLAGIERLGGVDVGTDVEHGTTVALNALLTRRFARAALVTNTGFRDAIEIGRQDRPELYALHPVKPEPLVPRNLRFELDQRSWPGENGVLTNVSRPTRDDYRNLARAIKRSGAESIAICLLHAYADPAIEEDVASALAPLGLPITTSAGILCEYREYERFSTACANAVLVPVMQSYLERLRPGLGGARLSILQSNGGTLPAERAATEPARVVLSGPAGGVVGAARAARAAGYDNIVTLDMGGTSTDVAFHGSRARLEDSVSTARVGDLPIALPSLDIHTIGCGGGSVVHLDAGGILHVGPRSAGADPGPVCHGRGDELTVTDAHVKLGHIRDGHFLRGGMSLDIDAVERGFEALGKRLTASPTAAAEAVLEVARAAMRRAIGVMTMQRGHDPRDLPLVAFGGAGGLSAAALADGLELPCALVPATPGCLSAFGLASADAIADQSRTLLEDLGRWPAKARRLVMRELAEAAAGELREAGHRKKDIDFEYRLDLRYRGQSFEIALSERFDAGVEEEFHSRHEKFYGWRLDSREVELVNLRARAVVASPDPELPRPRAKAMPGSARVGERQAWFGRMVRSAVIDRARLKAGHHFEGPALVEEYSGTTVVPPGWRARVVRGGHLELRPA